MLFETNTT